MSSSCVTTGSTPSWWARPSCARRIRAWPCSRCSSPEARMTPDTTRVEEAERDPDISKEQARPLITELRSELLKAQDARRENPQRSLPIGVARIDGAGKAATVHRIHD